MLERLKKLFSRRKPDDVEFFDEHLVSLGLLCLLLERAPHTPREVFSAIIRTQFSGDYEAWPDLDTFYAVMSRGSCDGFRAMSLIAYVTLKTNASLEQIAAMLKDAFANSGARELPEFIEAERRLSSASITERTL